MPLRWQRYLKIHTSISYTTLVLISLLFASCQKSDPWSEIWNESSSSDSYTLGRQETQKPKTARIEMWQVAFAKGSIKPSADHHGNRWAAYQLLSAGHMATWPPSQGWCFFHPVAWMTPCLNMLTVRRCVQQNFWSKIFFPTENWCILGAVSVECLISGFSIGPTVQPSYFKHCSHCSRWFQPALRYPQPQQSWSTSHRLKWAEPKTVSDKLTSQWKKKHVYFLLRKICDFPWLCHSGSFKKG